MLSKINRCEMSLNRSGFLVSRNLKSSFYIPKSALGIRAYNSVKHNSTATSSSSSSSTSTNLPQQKSKNVALNEVMVPLEPVWSLQDWVASFPLVKLSSEQFEHVHHLAGLRCPSRESHEWTSTKQSLEAGVRFVEGVRTIDVSDVKDFESSSNEKQQEQDKDKDNQVPLWLHTHTRGV